MVQAAATSSFEWRGLRTTLPLEKCQFVLWSVGLVCWAGGWLVQQVHVIPAPKVVACVFCFFPMFTEQVGQSCC